jgi:hypothetical protein
MKKLIVGAVGVLSSVILFGLTRVSAAVYALYLTQPGAGWNTNLGPFGTALRSIGTFPIIISVLLFLVGIYFIVMGFKEPK